MDDIARSLVVKYIAQTFAPRKKYETYIFWQCKTLQNWKFLISTSLRDGMYYELTYNGDNNEWYLDAYKKIENRLFML